MFVYHLLLFSSNFLKKSSGKYIYFSKLSGGKEFVLEIYILKSKEGKSNNIFTGYK
jgi:hypothetical protein